MALAPVVVQHTYARVFEPVADQCLAARFHGSRPNAGPLGPEGSVLHPLSVPADVVCALHCFGAGCALLIEPCGTNSESSQHYLYLSSFLSGGWDSIHGGTEARALHPFSLPQPMLGRDGPCRHSGTDFTCYRTTPYNIH